MRHLIVLNGFAALPKYYTGTVYYTNSFTSEWFIDGYVYKKMKYESWTESWRLIYFAYGGKSLAKFEEMFESLPEDHKEVIIWNWDIWNLKSTKELAEI